jgi:hypothetical protein
MEAAMENFDQRIRSRMELALEEVCRQLSKSGGDHESRKYIAKQLIRAARAGKIGLDDGCVQIGHSILAIVEQEAPSFKLSTQSIPWI